MVSRLLCTLFVVALMASGLHLSRPASIEGFELAPDARILQGNALSADAPIAPNDRVIAVNGAEVLSREAVERGIAPWDREVDLRVVSMRNLTQETLRAEDLRGDLPDILMPTHFVVRVDAHTAYGANSAEVARAIREHGSARVEAVPAEAVFDGTLPVRRGAPEGNMALAALVAALSLAILWGASPSLGLALGLAASGAGLWMLDAPITARFIGLGALCVSGAIGAWMLLQMLPQRGGGGRGRGRAKRYEGRRARPDLISALEAAEDAIGAPLYVVVGSSQQAVELRRVYERLSVEGADSVLTSSLSLLALEGGVFPRADVGEGVAEIWDDPVHDLDLSAGIAVAVPIPEYGSSQDQWAFLLTRTKDTPSTPQMLEPMLAIAALWAEDGVREAISVQAAHGLLHLLRGAKHSGRVVPHQQETVPDEAAPAVAAPPAHGAPEVVTNTRLDLVSEGIGVPRVVRREDLEKHRASAPERESTREIAAADAATPAFRARAGAAQTVRPSPASRGEQAHALAFTRAWAGHLERRWSDEYPVDDPRLFTDRDWTRVAKLRNDERPSLIFGEAGAGKEFTARALHMVSTRAKRPVAVVDCGRMPAASVELELFGVAGEPGVVAGLQGGALILKSVTRLGRPAAEALIAQLAKEDIRLFFVERNTAVTSEVPPSMLSVIHEKVGERVARIPPLRSREDDLPGLVEVLLETESMRYGSGELRSLDAGASRLLASMDLPGNFWELRSLLRAALLRADEDQIDVRALVGVTAGDVPRELAKIEEDEERQRLVEVLHETEGNKSEAARVLGLSRGALLRRLRRHGLM